MCHFGVIKTVNVRISLYCYRKHLESQYKLPYCDTDSFDYIVKHPDTYEWMKETKQHFDLSGYTRHDMQSNENTKS